MDPLLVLDADNLILRANEAAEKTFCCEGNLLNRPLGQLFPLRAETAQINRLRRFREGGRASEALGELTGIRAGKEFPMACSALLAHALGQGTVVLTLKDLSAQKELEKQLVRWQKMEVLGLLVGGVAHEFNNLLAVMLGYCDILMRGLNSEDPRHQDIREIKQAGSKAGAMTKQLLAFSRPLMPQPQLLDLNQVICEAEKMIGRLVGQNVHVNLALDDSLNVVKADRGQIDQALLNLAVNAKNAMPKGGRLLIETANEIGEGKEGAPKDLSGAYVRLSVIDQGVGMNREALSRILARPRGKRETGWGLFTVDSILRQSGGRVSVDSAPGKGTAFHLYFPSEVAASPGISPAAPAGPRGQETILLVEDDGSVRALAGRILSANGYNVLEAANAGEAVLISERHASPIHLLLTDVFLPHVNGGELYRRLARAKPGLKILFMSGSLDREALAGLASRPEMVFLSKPFSPGELLGKVRRVLDEDGNSRGKRMP